MFSIKFYSKFLRKTKKTGKRGGNGSYPLSSSSSVASSKESTHPVFSNNLILLHLFGYFSFNELMTLQRVNRYWHRVIRQLAQQVTNVAYTPHSFANPGVQCPNHSHHPHRVLRFSNSICGSRAVFDTLRFTPNVKVLKLSEIKFSASDVQCLNAQRFVRNGTLQHFELVDCELKECDISSVEKYWCQFFESLPNLRHLIFCKRSLYLFDSKVIALTIQKACPQLQYLTWKNNFQHLTNLWLPVIRSVAGAAFYRFGSYRNDTALHHLRQLNLALCRFTTPEMIDFENLVPNLESLWLGFDFQTRFQFKDFFAKCHPLVELHLTRQSNEWSPTVDLETIANRFGSTLKVLSICEFCICNQVTQKVMDKLVELHEFRLTETKNQQNCHRCLTSADLIILGWMNKLKIVRIDNFNFLDLDLGIWLQNGTTIRKFIFKYGLIVKRRTNSHRYLNISEFQILARHYPNEQFTIRVNEETIKHFKKHSSKPPENLIYQVFH